MGRRRGGLLRGPLYLCRYDGPAGLHTDGEPAHLARAFGECGPDVAGEFRITDPQVRYDVEPIPYILCQGQQVGCGFLVRLSPGGLIPACSQ